MKKPLLIVVSAASGCGKSTLCNRLLGELPDLRYSVSCTTRKPRGAEVDGVAYYFLTEDEFMAKVGRGELLEHAVVHGNMYGTPRDKILDAFKDGVSIILDIDVAGAAQVRGHVAQLAADDPLRCGFIDIFIKAPSMQELRRRITSRGEDTPESIEIRMRNAEAEERAAPLYSRIVVNDDLEAAYDELKSIILAKAEE